MAIRYTQLLDLDLNRITNLGAPAVSSDAVTKQYVDNIATGLIWKDAARVGADTNVNIASPGTTIDGVTLAAGDRVLLMGQTNATQNGIYTYSGTALVRATDADANSELRAGTAITVSEGTNTGNHTYVLITDGPVTIGTTNQSWSLLNAGTSPLYTAGSAIDVTNHIISVVPANNGGISVAGGVGVVTDGNGGLEVRPNLGVAVRLPAASGLKQDINGLVVRPRTDSGLDVDSGGAGIKLRQNYGLLTDALGLQPVLAVDKGLLIDNTGFQVKSGNGVATDSTGVRVVADNLGGLETRSSGIAAKLAGAQTGLASDSNGLTVLPSPTGGLKLALDGVAVKPRATDSGLTVDNSGVFIKLRVDDGLDVDSGGIGINTDALGGLRTGNTGLRIQPKTDAGITVDTNGVSVTLNPDGGVRADNFGLKVLPNLGVTSDPANAASIIVGTNGVSVNTAVVARRFAATVVSNNTDTSIPITHNLNTRDVQVELYSNAAPYDTVYAEVQRTSLNTVTLLFGAGSVPTNGQYRVVVVG